MNTAGTVVSSKSWYDCWDFTVRNATGEKPGRLYSAAWSFTGADFSFQFSTEFALFPLIPNPDFNNGSFFVKKVSYSRIRPLPACTWCKSGAAPRPVFTALPSRSLR